jgi:hypothetical protein
LSAERPVSILQTLGIAFGPYLNQIKSNAAGLTKTSVLATDSTLFEAEYSVVRKPGAKLLGSTPSNETNSGWSFGRGVKSRAVEPKLDLVSERTRVSRSDVFR